MRKEEEGKCVEKLIITSERVNHKIIHALEINILLVHKQIHLAFDSRCNLRLRQIWLTGKNKIWTACQN